MKTVFVYEYLSGGGELQGDDSDAALLLPMGRSMRDAIAADLLEARMYDVSVATCKLAPSVPDGARPVEPRPGESAFDFVARQGDAHALAWVVAPETGGLLAQLRQRVDRGRWLGCEGPAIELATRKRATLTTLAAAGIVTPLAFERAPETRRWVVKPDDGAGAVATRLHDTPEAAWQDWAARSKAEGMPMAIEAWVEGDAFSLSLLCIDAKHCELLSINRQLLRVDAHGLLSFEGVEVGALGLGEPRAATLRALGARVHQALPGLRGFVGIDFVWNAKRGPVVIEVNPRVTCAYVGLSRALGRNLAAAVIAAHDGTRARVPHA